MTKSNQLVRVKTTGLGKIVNMHRQINPQKNLHTRGGSWVYFRVTKSFRSRLASKLAKWSLIKGAHIVYT